MHTLGIVLWPNAYEHTSMYRLTDSIIYKWRHVTSPAKSWKILQHLCWESERGETSQPFITVPWRVYGHGLWMRFSQFIFNALVATAWIIPRLWSMSGDSFITLFSLPNFFFCHIFSKWVIIMSQEFKKLKTWNRFITGIQFSHHNVYN